MSDEAKCPFTGGRTRAEARTILDALADIPERSPINEDRTAAATISGERSR